MQEAGSGSQSTICQDAGELHLPGRTQEGLGGSAWIGFSHDGRVLPLRRKHLALSFI